MKTTLPKAVSRGDKIVVTAPASPAKKEDLQFGLSLLVKQGFHLEVHEICFPHPVTHRWPDELKAELLSEAWFDNDVSAIICARGGYGCSRLLSLLPLDEMARKPKLFVGYSDITTLHIALNNRGLATIHAPMLTSFTNETPDWIIQNWFNAMQGDSVIGVPSDETKSETVVGGIAEGIVAGGCLRMLCDSLGTTDEIITEGKIVLLEDVNEKPYRLDASLTHLLNSGKLQLASGLVVGEMTNTEPAPEEGWQSWDVIVRERLGKLNLPMVINFPFGHAKSKMSLPLGIHARLDANEGTLQYLELGVYR